MQQGRESQGSRPGRPLQHFLRLEASGGLVLMASAGLALACANTPVAPYYRALRDFPVTISFGQASLAKPLVLWINEGLMSVFFFIIGLELKREIVEGHLSTLRKAALPILAAIGGLVVPAAVYAAWNHSDAEALQGWAIPTATGIAFALGVLSLFGERVPVSLKVFLLSVAMLDDLGAILLIAVFYTHDLSAASLGIALALTLGLYGINRRGATRSAAYLIPGAMLWIAVLNSGVHATLAGAVTAAFVPLRPPAGSTIPPPQEALLRRLQRNLHPWVAFGVLPAFAFLNAGVNLHAFSVGDLAHPVALGIVTGLFPGKQIGILGLCVLGVRAGLASLPDGLGWRHLLGASLLCGIGFTMSFFIASLAFEHGATAYHGLERLGILIGSGLAAAMGILVLHQTLPPLPRGTASHPSTSGV